MASIYKKQDTGPGARWRWHAKLKVGSGYTVVSILLEAPGSKRLAKDRADNLQHDFDHKALSIETLGWIGEKARRRLQDLLSSGDNPTPDQSHMPKDWVEAGERFVKSRRARDTVMPIPGTTRTVERTSVTRSAEIRRVAKWFHENQIHWPTSNFTNAFLKYVDSEIKRGMQPGTIWSSYRYSMPWADWLHSEGVCPAPDRKTIQAAMPRKPRPRVILPSVKEDVAALGMFSDDSLRSLVHSMPKLPSLKHHAPYRKARLHWSAWSLILCTRGLGCRPSEATTLLWSSVDLAGGTVMLLSTKTRIPRKLPILYRWVLDGLTELKETFPNQTAVCCTVHGQQFGFDDLMYRSMRITSEDFGINYPLKQAQKLYIAQLLATGFTPHAVAQWTGHSLIVQETHYCADKSYLPTTNLHHYGKFGELTEWGLEVKKHLYSRMRFTGKS